MSIEANKAIFRRWFEVEEVGRMQEAEKTPAQIEKVIRKLAAETFAPEFVLHSTEGDVSLEEYVESTIEFLGALPDFNCTVEDIITEGDKVVIRMTMGGTQQGTYRGIPATGKKIEISGVGIGRFAGGKMVEGWRYTDRLVLMQQLGVIPTPGQG